MIAVQAAADQANLPEHVNLVLMVDTYHHIGDRGTYFRKLANWIKPGDRVAIIDFKPDSSAGPPKEVSLSREKVQVRDGNCGIQASGAA